MFSFMGRVGVVVVVLAMPATALAYDEAVSGDLSSSEAAPTPLTFGLGSNVLKGQVTAPTDTRDYITFTIPAGRKLTALKQMSYKDELGNPGNTGFNAINAGATSFVPSAATKLSFLGGDHITELPTGTDILPELSDGDTAGVGFTVPLGPGTYSYMIQQTGSQISVYNLEFVVTADSSVPASRPWTMPVLLGLLGATGLFVIRRRRLA